MLLCDVMMTRATLARASMPIRSDSPDKGQSPLSGHSASPQLSAELAPGYDPMPSSIRITLVRGKSKVIVGVAQGGQIDIGDIEALGADLSVTRDSAETALVHELQEQFQLRVDLLACGTHQTEGPHPASCAFQPFVLQSSSQALSEPRSGGRAARGRSTRGGPRLQIPDRGRRS